MTDEEIRQQIEQADVITLDYSKWSFQQRQANLPTDHVLWQQERDRVLSRQQSDNAEARQRHLNSLETARAAKLREYDAAIDAELAPERARLERAWLADHPNDTPADFEKKAWHHLKANLIEQRSAEAMEATKQQMAKTGRYSL